MNDIIIKIQFLGRDAIVKLLITNEASVKFRRNKSSPLKAAVLWGN